MASIDSVYRFTDLPDDALVARTRAIVGQSNQALAALLAHLGEVEARGLHRQRACASLYTYCVYELRMSEDAAFRRARAARIAREFPAVLDRVAAGEIHLTGLLMLGSHLTEENHVDVLERAKHRTKKEIAKLVREIDPLPDVPARVEPLGRTFTMPRAPSWSQFVASFASVRELDPGNRPRDWMDASPPEPEATPEPEPAPQPKLAPQPELAPQPNPMFARDDVPQRYSVQFTATEEYVELLERAKDLLSHTGEDKSLERVHVRALQSLVAELEKRRYGTGAKPRAPRADDVESTKHAGVPRQRGSSRHIPVDVRRAVHARDGGRCTYVDASGQRCRETRLLELHHEQPFARNGPSTAANVTLRCRSHNALAAEDDFGRDFMDAKKPPRAGADMMREGSG